jgi:enediyne biosynthesis protein E11
MAAPAGVIATLISEGEELDRLVAGLTPAQWALPTPAPGWTVAHQIAHLAATFHMAAMAAADPSWFKSTVATLGPDFNANVANAMARYLDAPPGTLLSSWRLERQTAERALAALPVDQMVPWLVRPIPVAMLASAGMMEMFAHGWDIADAVRVKRPLHDGIRYIVEFIVRTWDFGYQARGETPPVEEFRFELTAPSGERWEYGRKDAAHCVTGPAVDLAFLATRRRHRNDLHLTASGAEAEHWLDIAQCYRGPAGPGRTPGQFGPS